jgi:single-strand DNA-binding protein
MIHDAQVHLAGYVATEPRFKKVAGDTSSVRLRVAYTARRRDKETGEWSDGPTSFVTIQCWRTLADNVSMSVHKGEPVLIMGRLQIRRFEDAEGAPRTAVEVEASSVGHDLTRGVAQFSRTRWPAISPAIEAAAAPDGAPGSEEGAVPGDGAELADGLESAGRPNGASSGAAASGDGVIDERAVAEFARELSESLGAEAAANPAADGAEDAGTAAEAGMPA